MTFTAGSPAWEADDLPNELSLPPIPPLNHVNREMEFEMQSFVVRQKSLYSCTWGVFGEIRRVKGLFFTLKKWRSSDFLVLNFISYFLCKINEIMHIFIEVHDMDVWSCSMYFWRYFSLQANQIFYMVAHGTTRFQSFCQPLFV